MGISKQFVSLVERRALKKLRKNLKQRGLSASDLRDCVQSIYRGAAGKLPSEGTRETQTNSPLQPSYGGEATRDTLETAKQHKNRKKREHSIMSQKTMTPLWKKKLDACMPVLEAGGSNREATLAGLSKGLKVWPPDISAMRKRYNLPSAAEAKTALEAKNTDKKPKAPARQRKKSPTKSLPAPVQPAEPASTPDTESTPLSPATLEVNVHDALRRVLQHLRQTGADRMVIHRDGTYALQGCLLDA